MLSKEPQWVAVYTNPRWEKRVAEHLCETGWEAYVPIRRELHEWKDRKKWVETPLLKSYVFVKITDRQVVPLRQVPGIVYIISFKGAIATIPDREIQSIKDFLAAEVVVQVRTSEMLRLGRRVRIIGGALEGKEGMLVSDCEDGNFAMEITGISMAMIIHVEADLLEPLPDEEQPEVEGKRKQYNIR